MNQHTCVSLWGKSLCIHTNDFFLTTRLLYIKVRDPKKNESFLVVFDMEFIFYTNV